MFLLIKGLFCSKVLRPIYKWSINLYRSQIALPAVFQAFYFQGMDGPCVYRSMWVITSAWKKSESKVIQSCPTLCDPVDCSLPGSSVHGILQARTLEWVAISFSRGSSQSRDWTQLSRIVSRCFTVWATREVLVLLLHTSLHCNPYISAS